MVLLVHPLNDCLRKVKLLRVFARHDLDSVGFQRQLVFFGLLAGWMIRSDAPQEIYIQSMLPESFSHMSLWDLFHGKKTNSSCY